MLNNLAEVATHAAAQYRDRTALIFNGRHFSFQDLDAMACQVANGLTEKGIEPGDRVTLYSQNCWEWVAAYHGILKTGAVVNPINVMLTPEEVGYVTRDCGAKAIVASDDKGAALRDIQGDTPLEHIVLFGEGDETGVTRFDTLLQSGANRFESPAVDADALSTICYTSGTTGNPKGAMLSHRNVLLNTALTAIMHGRSEGDVAVTALPCAHVYGNVVMNGGLLYGMTFVMVERFEERAVMSAIQDNAATIYDGVPTSYMMLLAHSDFDSFDLSSLKRCTVGGQTMPVAKAQEVEARFGCPILELWGMTELAGLGTANAWYANNRHGSIGVSMPYISCRIADPEDPTKTLPPGEVGELMVKGPLVMQGYFGNEAATRETIEPDGWLHSGDLAKQDEDGFFFVVDRKKDMILTGGYNIYPAEIERVLAGHPAVAMAAVGPVPDETKGELAKAYIVLKPGASATEDEVANFCRDKLAAYKLPRLIKFVDALPTTSTGKIMRRELNTLDD